MKGWILFFSLCLLGCTSPKEYLDVSDKKEYSWLIGKTFSTKARMLAQSFDEGDIMSTRKIANGREVEIVDLLGYPGLKNRFLKWSVDVPVGERFKIVRVIKVDVGGGGFHLYYQVESEHIERLKNTITLIRVPDSGDIAINAGLPVVNVELIE